MTPREALHRAKRRARARPVDAALAVLAISGTAAFIALPFTAATYPPITDLPMHAAVTSAFRHWFDPAWHFQDQFELQPFQVPLLTFYGLGAIFALVLPIAAAVKLATVVMLSTLPIGAAMLCHALKKSAFLGIAAGVFAFGTMTQWGFMSFIASLGLTMAGAALAIRLLERPTRARSIALGAVSLLVFFTHVSRFPVYAAALGVVTGTLWPIMRRVRPVVLAVAPSVALFCVWFLERPASLAAAVRTGWHFERLGRVGGYLFGSFGGDAERITAIRAAAIVAGVAVFSLAVRVVSLRRAKARLRPRRREVYRFLAAFFLTGMFTGLFLWMPMKIGEWSWVFPREATAAALASIALLPDLPRTATLRVPAVLALLSAVALPARYATARYAAFGRAVADFSRVLVELPPGPKLGYIMQDKTIADSGATTLMSPLLHFPAWVQAERGGWLSFHFATWNALPIRFRTDDARDVAPETPPTFEWFPNAFNVSTRGKYFDWFLVRANDEPREKMAADPAIRLVDNQGLWWLYRRDSR